MASRAVKTAIFVAAPLALAGCVVQSQPSYMANGYAGNVQPSQQQALQPQQPAAPQAQPQAMPVQYQIPQQVISEISSMRERVRRVERAMIRLDRRMQLIERNELSRMSGQHMQGEATPAPSGMFQPMSFKDQAARAVAPQAQQQKSHGYAVRTMPFQRQVQKGGASFRPVSMPNQKGMITSSLQVAPAQAAHQKNTKGQVSSLSKLPSLADDNANTSKNSASISVWTIRYDESKVWPDRTELKGSHDVVQALRSDEPVALFARGARPASREFRERVRAVSKYLSKVSKLQNVPIASMPAKHLDGDTIEIFATK